MEQWVIRSLTDRFPIRSGLTVLWITVGELSNFLLSAAVFFFRDLKMFFVTMQCLLVYEGFYYIYLCGTISYLQLILDAFFFSSFYFAWVGFVAFFFTALANSNRHKLIAFFLDCHFLCVRVRPAWCFLQYFLSRDFATFFTERFCNWVCAEVLSRGNTSYDCW